MKYAYENNIPVTPRGAGTGLVGSSVAIEHGIMIDSSLMNHILELDEENLTITVEPGVLLMELAAYVEDHDSSIHQIQERNLQRSVEISVQMPVVCVL